MRALAVSDRGVGLVEVDEPVAGHDDAVVAVHACAICGSDLKAAGSPGLAGRIIGHEFSGTVVALGDEVGGVDVGAHVAVNPIGSCGACDACRKGLPFLCRSVPNVGLSADGGYAERVAVPARQLSVLDDGVEVDLGSHAEPLAVALAAIDQAEVAPGSDVLVPGVGPIGLLAIAAMRAIGVRTIVAVGRAPGRRRAAATLGADVVLDAREGDLSGRLRALKIDFDAVIESTGAPEMLTLVAPLIGIGGAIAEVALSAVPTPLDLRALVGRGLKISGVCAFAPSHYTRAVELLSSGAVDPGPLISERVGLADAPDAFERLRDPGELVGIVVEPWR